MEKYYQELKNRNWMVVDKFRGTYCKQGASATIFTAEEKFKDINVVSISMAYDRDTVKKCSSAPIAP